MVITDPIITYLGDDTGHSGILYEVSWDVVPGTTFYACELRQTGDYYEQGSRFDLGGARYTETAVGYGDVTTNTSLQVYAHEENDLDHLGSVASLEAIVVACCVPLTTLDVCLGVENIE